MCIQHKDAKQEKIIYQKYNRFRYAKRKRNEVAELMN